MQLAQLFVELIGTGLVAGNPALGFLRAGFGGDQFAVGGGQLVLPVIHSGYLVAQGSVQCLQRAGRKALTQLLFIDRGQRLKLLTQPTQFLWRLIQPGLQSGLLFTQGFCLLQRSQRLLPGFLKLLLFRGGSAAVGQRSDISLQALDGAEFGLAVLRAGCRKQQRQAGE